MIREEVPRNFDTKRKWKKDSKKLRWKKNKVYEKLTRDGKIEKKKKKLRGIVVMGILRGEQEARQVASSKSCEF